jgi:hypothetical protein
MNDATKDGSGGLTIASLSYAWIFFDPGVCSFQCELDFPQKRGGLHPH